jgi:hypothetical protein
MYDAGIDLEKTPVQDTNNVRVKPVAKGPTKLVLLIVLLGVSGFGTYSFLNKGTGETKNIKLPNQQISEVIESDPAPSVSPSPEEDLVDGETPDKKVDLKLLSEEITQQLNNHYYSRRNFLLRKAGDQVASGGKNYEYYLLQELVRVREQLKTELLQNNQKSVSGIGGEFGANAEQSEKVRGLFGDMMAIVLAFDYIYQLPSEAKPDADSLISRVSIGETLNRLLNFEVSAKRDIQSQVWQLIERSNNRAIADKELEADGKELTESLKK